MYVVGADLKGILSTDYFNVKGPQLRAVVNSVRTLGNEEEEGRKRGISLVGKGSRWLRAISSGAAELGGDVMSKHTKRREEGKGEPSDSAGEIELDDLFFGKDGGGRRTVSGANPMHSSGNGGQGFEGRRDATSPVSGCGRGEAVGGLGKGRGRSSGVPSAPSPPPTMRERMKNRPSPSEHAAKLGTNRSVAAGRMASSTPASVAAAVATAASSTEDGDDDGGGKKKWDQRFDSESGSFYYEDKESHATQWEEPEGF